MKDLELLMKAADEIANAVNKRYPLGGGGKVVRSGHDGDPTKEMDQFAEDVLFEWMDRNGLDWNVISEESGSKDRGGSSTLIVDPIDGTYNAVNGIPLFSTSLALMDKTDPGKILAGVVANVPTGNRFWAEKGGGAYLDGRVIHTRRFRSKEAVFSTFIGKHAVEENRRLLAHPRRARYFGCISLEICYVAKGALDLFAIFSRIPRMTDVAAAHLILNEAGGESIKIDRSKDWTRYIPGDQEGIKGIISIGDSSAVNDIMGMLGELR